MSQGFSINVGGNRIQINARTSIDEIKTKLPEDKIEAIFEGVDANENNTLDTTELTTLKENLKKQGYEVSQDGKTPKQAFNEAIQNMGNRYNEDSLKNNFKSDDAERHEIKYGDTLYHIAKKALKEEGLPTDNRSVNNRIAEIAKINNLKDVNNVPIGTKIIYKLTQAGIDKVKNTEGQNSAVAFGTQQAPSKPENAGQDTSGAGTPPSTADKKSNITINEIKDEETLTKDGWTKDESANVVEGQSATKYTNGEQKLYRMTVGNVILEAETLDALGEKYNKYNQQYTDVNTQMSSEEFTATKQKNLTIIKEQLDAANYSIEAIKKAAETLRDESKIDMGSDEYKEFVQNLLLTRNAEVINALIYKDTNGIDTTAIEQDETAHQYLAGMYQELIQKEKSTQALTEEEIALKTTLKERAEISGYKIKGDVSQGIYEKYLEYNENGELRYSASSDGETSYYAQTQELLDKFMKDLDAAADDNAKKELFKKYSSTQDKELAKCLAAEAVTLQAADEDINLLINLNDLSVVAALPTENCSNDVYKTAACRAKQLYEKEDSKGNPENAIYLENAMTIIDNVTVPEGQTFDKDGMKTAIAETYFNKEDKGEGDQKTTTYTFTPSRCPTYDEAVCFATHLPGDTYKSALINYITLENMGANMYSNAIEKSLSANKKDIVQHYATLIANMNADQIIDFIENKVTEKSSCLPFDKIIEKSNSFTDEEKNKILELLKTSYTEGTSIASDANKAILQPAQS